jgi:hypothetical protein
MRTAAGGARRATTTSLVSVVAATIVWRASVRRARGAIRVTRRARRCALTPLHVTLPVAETLWAVRLRFRSAPAPAGRAKPRFEYLSFLVDTRPAPRTKGDRLSAVCCPPARIWTPRN